MSRAVGDVVEVNQAPAGPSVVRGMKPRLLVAVVLCLALTPGVVSLAQVAGATVHVQVRPAADGTVTLTCGARAFTCHTQAGTCTIAQVPGGPASATFTPEGGQATPARPVMIGPSGDVNLILPSGR